MQEVRREKEIAGKIKETTHGRSTVHLVEELMQGFEKHIIDMEGISKAQVSRESGPEATLRDVCTENWKK